ncbi:hypothetical protein PDENDC454_02740 [Paenibacillus dendritiformis C454]|uniref:Uncharacterized protein n=1 Tax=Paenibacillus dendritiformis C454 TaxID=1131935 RepID=H3SAL3_9BACL|nr:hypothetical protein PDENDC454_02740 [Paenibacillus dendritiformis C454]
MEGDFRNVPGHLDRLWKPAARFVLKPPAEALLLHHFQYIFHTEEDALEVGRYDAVEFFFRNVREQEWLLARIVEELYEVRYD